MKRSGQPSGELGPKDVELLQKVRDGGPYFTMHAAHEARAHKLWRAGYLDREQVEYSRSARVVQYRWRYKLTERGRNFSS